MTISKKGYIDVNEHERLSNFMHKTQSKGAELLLSALFHSYGRVYNIEHNSYSKMSVARLLAYSWTVTLYFCLSPQWV